MNNRKILTTLLPIAVLLVSSVFLLDTGVARVDKGTRLRLKLRKADIVDQVWVGYNNWRFTMQNNGVYMLDAQGNAPGGQFPRGSGQTIMYSAGLYVGTIKDGIAVVSNSDPSGGGTTWQPGAITNSGVSFNQLTASGPEDPANKVYVLAEVPSGDQSATADDDYDNWPGDRDSVTNAPVYLSDARTWAVFNDLDTTLNFDGAASVNQGLGLNVILESFSFNTGPAQNAVFVRFTIENRTNVDYSQSYIALYSDPDVNNFQDDVVGCDTVRGLGFCYNTTASDVPSTAAFDFLQGPIVNISEISSDLATKFAANTTAITWNASEGIFEPRALPAGQIWLGATSFNTYANGTDPDTDQERYWLMEGKSLAGVLKTGTGRNYRYAYPGNPVVLPPGTTQNDPVAPLSDAADQRMLLATGPFTIKAGDQQQIWAAVIGANGPDRLGAISNLYTFDDGIQDVFNGGLVTPTAPDVPKLTVNALDNKVILSWDNAAEFSEDIYGERAKISIANGYSDDYVVNDFQGYRVYRSRTGLPGSWLELAEYDKPDGITVITDRSLTNDNQLVIERIEIGTDNGLQYHYVDETALNGQVYYYSVTSYDVQPDFYESTIITTGGDSIRKPANIPITLETAQTANVVRVIPMQSFAGVGADGSVGSVSRLSGGSDGTVEVEVYDPTKVISGSYRISFFLLPDSTLSPGDANRKPYRGLNAGDIAYTVQHSTLGSRMFANQVDDPNTYIDNNLNNVFDAGDAIYDDRYMWSKIHLPGEGDEFPIVDGLVIKVANAAPIMKSVTYQPGSIFQGLGITDPWYSGPGGLIYGDGLVEFTEEFWGVGGVDIPDRKDIDLRFSRNPSEWSMIYKHGTGSSAAVNDTCLAPFSAWEVDAGDGNATPRRINVNFRDRDTYDAWTPDGVNSTGGVGRFNYTYFLTSDYDSGTTAFATIGQPFTQLSYQVMWMGYNPDLAEAVTLSNLYVTSVAGGLTHSERHNIFSNWVDNGTIQFRPNHILSVVDTLAFSTTAQTVLADKKTLKKGLKNIKVVPNPYMARSQYQRGLFDKQIRFTNLPATCTIRIFNVAGDLVNIIQHNSGSNNSRLNDVNPLEEGVIEGRNITPSLGSASATTMETYDLRNFENKLIASGVYIALVEAPGIGTTTVKFAVIQQELVTNSIGETR